VADSSAGQFASWVRWGWLEFTLDDGSPEEDRIGWEELQVHTVLIAGGDRLCVAADWIRWLRHCVGKYCPFEMPAKLMDCVNKEMTLSRECFGRFESTCRTRISL